MTMSHDFGIQASVTIWFGRLYPEILRNEALSTFYLWCITVLFMKIA